MVANPSAIPGQLDEHTIEPSESQLRDIISRCPKIPAGIQNATFSYLSTRVLDQGVYNDLISQSSSGPDWSTRIDRRKENLREHIGQYLTCVFIRLPGVHYTVEIDPTKASVVHWEWQSI